MGCKLMKNKLKSIILVLGIALIVTVALFTSMVWPTNNRDNKDIAKQHEMMRIILDCGELAPIPKSASIKTVKTEGNMFTRSFRLVFEADAKTIDTWLNSSKGIKAAKITKDSGSSKYILDAKRGFQYAEVNVDQHNNRVTVYVSHS